MKKSIIYLRLLWISSFLLAFTSQMHGQYISARTNPSPIIPSGEALEFTVLLSPGNNPESYLMVYAPADWTITGSNPSGDISADKTTTKISFSGLTQDTEISVFMKPGCDIVTDSQVKYEFYNNSDALQATGYSPGISNIKYPVFIFTAPADTAVRATMEAYREWQVQQNEEDAYLMGGDLTMHMKSEPGYYSDSYPTYVRILAVEMLTNSGWEEVNATIAEDQLSYSYTFTSDDFKKTGNGDTILTNTETLRVREKIWYDYCYTGTPTLETKLIYTPEHRCSQSKINRGEAYVNYANPFSSSIVSQSSYTMPQGPDINGKFIFRLVNPNPVTAKNLYHTFYTASSNAYHIKAKDVYFSDISGNKDTTAPPISYSYVSINNYELRINYTSTTPYKGLYAADEDGICNDLAPTGATEYIYVTVEWNADFTYAGICNPTGNYFTNSTIYRYSYYTHGNCTLNSSTYSPISGENLGFSGWVGYLSNPNLVYNPATETGTQSPLTIRESPIATSSPNGSRLKDGSQVSHQVELVLPGNIKYIAENGVKINDIEVAPADISYDPATNTLIFYNRDPSTMTSDISYTFTIEAASSTDSSDKQVAISHIFNWGNESYRYSCNTMSLNYIIRVPGICDYITATTYRAERSTLGFKSKNFDTFSSLQEARDAGVDLNVVGPYDNVEFEINANVVGEDVYEDDNKPLYADVFYMNTQGASQPYFNKGEGAILQYQKPGEAWSSEIPIPADDMELLYENGTHHLRVDIIPYLQAEGVSLVKDTKLKILFLAQATEYLPATKTAVELLLLGIYREDRYVWDCNAHADNLFVWDYRLRPAGNTASSLPRDIIFWHNAQEGYKTVVLMSLNMNNGISGLTEEIFPNEFRPNGIVNSFTWNGASPAGYGRSVIIERIYDSEGREFYEGNDYSISYNMYGTTIVFNDLNAYTGEYYNAKDDVIAGEKGKHSYYIFADMLSICTQSAAGYNYTANPNITHFPTAASPLTNTSSGNFICYPFNSSSAWSISTSTTNSYHTTADGVFSWPLRLSNNSLWARTTSSNPSEADYKIPYTYLFVEVSDGDIEDFELYRITGGSEVKIDAPFEEYTGRPGYRSYWIKLGEIECEYSTTIVSVADFVLKARQPDCSVNNIVNLTAKFGVNTVTYPDDPYTGFSQFGYTNCSQDYPTLALSGTFHLMDFSGTVDESAGMDADEKFELCHPIPLSVKFQNNLLGPTTGLQVKIARDLAEALVLEDPTVNISFTHKGTTYPFDSTWQIDDSQDKYILIKLPESVILEAKDQAGDNLVVNFAVTPMCDFLFGLPIYMDVIGTSMCDLTESKNIATANIRLAGYDENENPVSRLESFSVTKTKDNTEGPVFSYLEENDGIFKLKGQFVYQTIKSNVDGQATLRLPDNIELVPGGVNRFERVGGGNTSSFVYNRGLYRASFNDTENSPATYEFELDVRLINPQEWACETYTIEINSVVNIEMYCDPADPEPCMIDYANLSTFYSFTIEKYDLSIVSEKVTFTEYYDETANAGRLKINTSIANNGAHDMEDAAFYLYMDTNKNGIYDSEDTQLLSGPLFTLDIISGDEVEVETIIETLSADETCNLMLVMPCYSGVNRFLCDSAFVKKEILYELATTDYRICQGADLVIGDPALGNYSYTWSTTGSGQFSDATNAQPTYTFPLTGSLNGSQQSQRLKLVLDRDPDGTTNCVPQELYVNVYVEPKKSEWTGLYNSNWEDTDNWSNGLPGKCTYVTIPEQADYYPVLTKDLTDTDAARCDTIEFLHGAEVAKTWLLDYNAAKVNMTLDPDRWNMIASPLRYMYTGDYYVNDYNPNSLIWGRTPDVYWMYYRMANPQNEKYYHATYYWSMPFNILEEPMQTGKGLVVWADLETHMGTGGPSGLMPPADNKARFTFPRPENEYYYYYGLNDDNELYDKTGSIAEHPITKDVWVVDLDRKHEADADSLRSRFNYEGLPSFNPLTGSFTMETYVDDVLAPTALVGNPFMSHLDLRAFQQANASMIGTDFYIWADNSSGGFFEAVKLLSEMDHLSTLSGNATVAPMQSFIVVKQPDPVTFGNLTITPAMSVTTPTSKLRSATVGENINISLYNLSSRESAISLLFREGVSNAYHKEKDQYTLFPAEETSMVLYAITEEEDTM
ncbi:MAG: hypothetical protein LUG18_09830 [Candidatus Azobacteroides sp.]|nr:hypothetical protein [Candidatus Azobacteroides sp.]